jgi:hypothetical protein
MPAAATPGVVSDRPGATLLTHADQLQTSRPASAVDKQTVNGSEERHRAARHAREL